MNSDELSPASQLDRALAEYVRRVEANEPLSEDELLAEFPDVADRLRGCLEVISALDGFLTSRASAEGRLDDTRPLRVEESDSPASPKAPQSPDAPPADFSVGTAPRRFGDYELLEEVARGGMGVVFKARQVSLNRVVALKMILSGQLAGREEVQRFHVEAEAAARLDHPGIVPIFEIGEHNGQCFFSMGFIEGTSLAARGAQGPLPPDAAARIVKQVADAVQFAHSRGIIHRDLKPANVLLDGDGQPRITDFGLAKSLNVDSQLTGSGQVLGTPSYMPPEQAAAKVEEIGPPADVYALGSILYFLLTGRPPFQASSPMETLRQVLEEEPVGIRQLNPGVPRDLETIALRCLAKVPARRCATARELADELGRYLADEPIRSRPTGAAERMAKWAVRHPAISISSTVVALAALIAFMGITSAWRHAELAREDATAKLRDSYLAHARAGRWSRREGRRFAGLEALRKAAAIRPSLELRNEAIACLALTDVEVENEWSVADIFGYPDFSESLDRYAYSDPTGTIHVHSLPDGKEIARFDAGPSPTPLLMPALRFSPDGTHLAVGLHYDSEHQFSVWKLTCGERLLNVPQGIHAWAMDFTPDGQTVAAGRSDGTVHLYDVASGRETAWRPIGFAPHTIRFAPQQPQLAASGNQRVRILNIDTGEQIRDLPHPDVVRGITWSPSGELLAAACADYHIHVWNAATGTRRHLLEGHQSEATYVTFNHRGDVLASHGWETRSRLWDARSGAALISFPGLALRFSTDDHRLAVSGPKLGIWNVADAAECRQIPGDLKERLWSADVSRDGRIVALARQDGVRLYEPATGREVARLDDNPTRGVWFEPAGGGIVTWGTAGLRRWHVERHPAHPDSLIFGKPQSLGVNASEKPEFATMSSDGKTVALGDRLLGRITVFDLSTNRAVQTLPHLASSRVTVSTDGAWLVGSTWWGTPEGVVRLWDIHRGVSVAEWTLANQAAVAFSPNSKWLWIGAPREGKLIEVGSWKTIREAKYDGLGQGDAVFSPDSSLLAVNGSMNLLQLVDPLSGDELATLEAGRPLCFSRDGRLLITVADQQVVQVWDLSLIRRELADMGLDWAVKSPPEQTLQSARP